METYIYDIDGTLTLEFGDKASEEHFDTYAFWPLINYYFAKDSKVLHQKTKNWDCSYKGENDEFIKGTQNIVQISIAHFHENVTRDSIVSRAKNITHEFITHNIIRQKAIAHLKKNIELNNTCILSTSSYQDGAYGFVLALIEENLLPINTLDKIIISGSIIDWQNRVVLHTNIDYNKIIGLYQQCAKQGIQLNPGEIKGIYINDPEGNDSGLCDFKLEAVFLIETNKNKDKKYIFNKENW